MSHRMSLIFLFFIKKRGGGKGRGREDRREGRRI
jgi:hypothetical protein